MWRGMTEKSLMPWYLPWAFMAMTWQYHGGAINTNKYQFQRNDISMGNHMLCVLVLFSASVHCHGIETECCKFPHHMSVLLMYEIYHYHVCCFSCMLIAGTRVLPTIDSVNCDVLTPYALFRMLSFLCVTSYLPGMSQRTASRQTDGRTGSATPAQLACFPYLCAAQPSRNVLTTPQPGLPRLGRT